MRTVFGANKRLITICTSVPALSIIAFVTPRISGPALATSDDSAYTVPLAEDTNPDPTIVETDDHRARGRRRHQHRRRRHQRADVQRHDSRSRIPPERGRHRHRALPERPRTRDGHSLARHRARTTRSDGTPLTQNMVEPGDSFLYKFKVSRPGIYWYHPHHHSSTNQVFKGHVRLDHRHRSGRGPLQASGVLPSAAQTRTLVLSDITVCKAVGAATTHDTYSHDACRTSAARCPSSPGRRDADRPLRDVAARRGRKYPPARIRRGRRPQHPEAGHGIRRPSTKDRPC